MVTSSNRHTFRVTGPLRPLWGEFTDHRWISLTKASDAELWYIFFICAWTVGLKNNRNTHDLRRHRTDYDALIKTNHLADQWLHISMTCQWQPSCDDFKTTARANMGSHDDMSTFLLKTYRNVRYSWKIMFFEQVWWCFSIVFHNGIVRLTWQTNFLKQFILNKGKNVNHNLARARLTNMDHL